MPRKAYTPKELRELAAEPYDVFHPHLLDTMRGALRFCADVIDAANEALTTQAGAAAAEPIYQISGAFADDPKCTWRDASKSDYDMHTASKRRILYATPLTSAPAVPEASDFEQKRARTLLAHLWRRYDAAGTSMGRSHEAVVLEAVLSLLGDPDRVDMALLDKDSGHFIDATRTYLSSKMAERLRQGRASWRAG